MSSNPLTPSFRRVHVIPSNAAHPKVVEAIRDNDKSITDLNQAIRSLKTQLTAAQNTAASATTENITTETISDNWQFLGTVNNQLGEPSYTTQQSDNGAKVIVGDSTPVSVTLSPSVTLPWFALIGNDSTSGVTLSASSPATIYGAHSIAPGCYVIIYYDGAMFWSELAGNVSGMGTTGFIPVWTGPKTLGDSPLDDSITVPNSVTSSKLFNSVGAAIGNFLNAIGLAGAASEVFDLFGVPGAGAMASWGAQDPSSSNIFGGTIFLGAYVPDPTTPVSGDDFGGIDYRGIIDNAGHITGSALVLLATINGYYAFQGTQDGSVGIGGQNMVGGPGSPDPQNGILYIPGVGTPIFNLPFATVVYSAAGTAIPSAATAGAGARAFVSDATVNTFASAYVSGGANKVPVYSDGTGWFIG